MTKQRIQLKENKDLTVKQAHENFMRHCKIKNLSEYTVQYYKEAYGNFKALIDESKPISTITLDDVENLTMTQQERKLAVSSINTRIRGVRTFLYFCMERDYMQKFNIVLLNKVRLSKKLILMKN